MPTFYSSNRKAKKNFLPKLPFAPEFQELDFYSKSSVDYIFEKNFRKKEELVVAYERMLNKILIMNPWTLSEVKIKLLTDLDDRVRILLRAQEEKREDTLHVFFSNIPNSITISSDDISYLRKKLKEATIDFNQMCKQDSRFNKLVTSITLSQGNIHCQYQNLWNKKVAWWMRTEDEHQQVIDTIVSTLTKDDRESIVEKMHINAFDDDIKAKFKNI